MMNYHKVNTLFNHHFGQKMHYHHPISRPSLPLSPKVASSDFSFTYFCFFTLQKTESYSVFLLCLTSSTLCLLRIIQVVGLLYFNCYIVFHCMTVPQLTQLLMDVWVASINIFKKQTIIFEK